MENHGIVFLKFCGNPDKHVCCATVMLRGVCAVCILRFKNQGGFLMKGRATFYLNIITFCSFSS